LCTTQSPLSIAGYGFICARCVLPGIGPLREMIGFTAQRLMELEVEGLTGAAYGEKSPERLAQRNGYRG
jgi:putative transposase